MEPRSLKFVAGACFGELNGPAEKRVSRVCTDSRKAEAGDLFFAVRGERFDGHDFLAEAARKGVAAVVIERQRSSVVPPPGCAVVRVNDTRTALGKLAAVYRGEFSLPMIAVGGSNGKTTTKDLIASVLRQKLATLWSEASFNNDIGVPLTLLRLDRGHQVAALEVGTNHHGELAPLVRMIRPTVAIITNIAREHLEFFGDVKGVVEEEGWLAELLPADGKIFLNGDDEWSKALAERTAAGVIRVGMGEGNDWRARDIRLSRESVTFHVESPWSNLTGEYRLNLLGQHQAVNALFALAIGAELGLTREEIERGLAECRPAKMRLQLWEAHGVTVLDDTYNANADSMMAALHVLKELPGNGRRLAVLGDMAELGAHREAAHAEVGRLAAQLDVGQLFAVGEMAGVMARAAREAGLKRVVEFADVETAAKAMKSFVKTGDVVLLKASRATRLERVTEVLRSGGNGR
jgi:UDP-N-acetylmuramoyl-tripeptide--D-alanyl-D-alanine ligase